MVEIDLDRWFLARNQKQNMGGSPGKITMRFNQQKSAGNWALNLGQKSPLVKLPHGEAVKNYNTDDPGTQLLTSGESKNVLVL